jgi:3',5'-cyclic-AMP phosphodiesterase
VRGRVRVGVRICGQQIEHVMMAIDGNPVQSLNATDACTWATEWDSTRTGEGLHVLSVTATVSASQTTDSISILVNQRGAYTPPVRHALDYETTLGEWPEKHILGTQLGPNENGRHWPSRRQRKHATR